MGWLNGWIDIYFQGNGKESSSGWSCLPILPGRCGNFHELFLVCLFSLAIYLIKLASVRTTPPFFFPLSLVSAFLACVGITSHVGTGVWRGLGGGIRGE